MEKNQLNKEAIVSLCKALKDRGSEISAIIVLKSIRTGNDFTYKIRTSTSNVEHSVRIAYEESYDSYKLFYFLIDINGQITYPPNSSDKPVIANGIWLLKKLYGMRITSLMAQVELYHIGKCIRCNRPLTDLESIEYGMGKECRSK